MINEKNTLTVDQSTCNLSQYIKEKGINIQNLAKALDIPYYRLYDSLGSMKKKRPLKGDELLKICRFLNLDPFDFLN